MAVGPLCVSIWSRVMSTAAPSLEPRRQTAVEHKDRNLAVLIVDDDEGMRHSVRRLLQMDGYAIEMVGSSRELRAKADVDKFFAILLDRRLPDADGSELLEELKQRAPQASILIVTGHADMDSTLRAIRNGVHDYLIKPVDPETLRSRLNTLAEFYRVRQELQVSERRMRFLVENLPAGAVYIDDQQLFGNKTLERMTGYAAAEMASVDQWFRLLCQDQAGEARAIYEGHRRRNFNTTFRIPIIRADRAPRTLEIAGYRYGTHELWLVTDITELQEAERRMVQSERLAAIGQMVTGLAHESRNALQRARACLDLLELDLQDSPEQLNLTGRIRVALGDLQRNYEEVRNYAAPIVLEPVTTNLASILRNAFENLRCEFNGRQHQLNIQDDTGDETLRVDRYRLTQVFRNIFDNAIAASSSDCQLDARLSSDAINGHRFQRIDIRDHGCGIPEQALLHMFDPFFTTKSSGTGLGMAICKRIIEAHGGCIMAHNAEDGPGAIITIRLPYQPPSPGMRPACLPVADEHS